MQTTLLPAIVLGPMVCTGQLHCEKATFDEHARASHRTTLPCSLRSDHDALLPVGVRRESERHSDSPLPHRFRAQRLSVVFHSGGVLRRIFPGGMLMERIGYKRGILVGLFLCALGALLFLPASSVRVYGFFLFALFVMACGQSFLEVASNPYVTILGPAQSSERRLNFAQSFNAVGAVLSPLVGRSLILTGVEYTPAQLAVMSAAQVQAYRAEQAGSVKLPYLVMAGIFVVVAAAIYVTHLPDVVDEGTAADSAPAKPGGSVRAHPHLIKGVLAQFFYVGAQVGVASFVIRFAQHTVPGMTQRVAAYYLLGHQIGFMIGRFAGSALMKVIAPARLLSIFAIGCLASVSVALLARGIAPVWAVVLIGFFHSIMFPTIRSEERRVGKE